MARPIKETPILEGEDAKRFAEAARTVVAEPKEVIEKARQAFEKFQKSRTKFEF